MLQARHSKRSCLISLRVVLQDFQETWFCTWEIQSSAQIFPQCELREHEDVESCFDFCHYSALCSEGSYGMVSQKQCAACVLRTDFGCVSPLESCALCVSWKNFWITCAGCVLSTGKASLKLDKSPCRYQILGLRMKFCLGSFCVLLSALFCFQHEDCTLRSDAGYAWPLVAFRACCLYSIELQWHFALMLLKRDDVCSIAR